MKTEDYKRELLHIFFAQFRLILGITALVFLGALAIYLFAPVKYAAYGSVLIRGKAPVGTPQSLDAAEARSLPVRKEDLYSEVQLLQSTEVIGRSLRRLNGGAEIDAEILQAGIAAIRSDLVTEVLPASNVVQLTLKSDDPKKAVITLDLLMKEYLRYRMEVGRGSDAQAFFGEQADQFRQQLEDGERDLDALYREAGSADPQKEIETQLLIKRDLELELSDLKGKAIEHRATLEQLSDKVQTNHGKNLPFMRNPTMQKLNNRLIILKTERSKLLRTYLPDSKAVAQVNKETEEVRAMIRSEVSQYRRQVSAELAVVEKKLGGVQARMAEIDARNLELQSQIVATRRLEREAALQQQSYETFAKRREEARIQNAMENTNLSSYVAVFNRAYPSNGPVFPKPILLPLGLLSGLLLGVTLGFSREYFDHSFKKPSDVERVLDLPVVFSLNDMGVAPRA